MAGLARGRHQAERAGGLSATAADLLEARIDALLERRMEASERFFAVEADRIAELCRELAERFERGGRLVAVGGSAQAWSDAHHIAVEFVHPVIVGKRALPALATAPEEVALIARPEDAVVSFEPLTVRTSAGEWRFDPPSDDPFVRQELCETLYHLVWELVHVFFEHLGSSTAGGGAAGFLYPFLESGGERGPDAVARDVSRSVLLKAEEIGALRTQTLRENRSELVAAAAALHGALVAGGTLHAFGNGGSATDAADLVADFRSPPQGWPPLGALDLTGDSAILTALANDIGPEVLFARQLIAYGRRGDIALAVTTSGGSGNILEALAEARRRGLVTIALVGYDGGRIAAEALADYVIVTRSDHIPRIQEAQASAYHVLRELVALAG